MDVYDNGEKEQLKIFDLLRHVTSPGHVTRQKRLSAQNENHKYRYSIICMEYFSLLSLLDYIE